uniref:Uncharacterized protein n=1 Tax=Nothobranchius rachovii TaxID=451742 RepID=A0A1A8QPF8_9TELE
MAPNKKSSRRGGTAVRAGPDDMPQNEQLQVENDQHGASKVNSLREQLQQLEEEKVEILKSKQKVEEDMRILQEVNSCLEKEKEHLQRRERKMGVEKAEVEQSNHLMEETIREQQREIKSLLQKLEGLDQEANQQRELRTRWKAELAATLELIQDLKGRTVTQDNKELTFASETEDYQNERDGIETCHLQSLHV